MDIKLSSIEISNASGCHLVFSKEEVRRKVENTTRQIVITPDDLLKACDK